MFVGRRRGRASGRDLRDGRRDGCYPADQYHGLHTWKSTEPDVFSAHIPTRTYEERRAQVRGGTGSAAFVSSLHLAATERDLELSSFETPEMLD